MARLGQHTYQFSFEEVWCSVVDVHFRYRPRANVFSRKVDKLVLPAPSGVDARAALFGEPFDEHLLGVAQSRLVADERAALNDVP